MNRIHLKHPGHKPGENGKDLAWCGALYIDKSEPQDKANCMNCLRIRDRRLIEKELVTCSRMHRDGDDSKI